MGRKNPGEVLFNAVLLESLRAAKYILIDTKRPRVTYGPPPTKRELEELEALQLELAKPFNYTKRLIWQSIFIILVFAAPLLGAYLYCFDIWMFFCVLISGFLGFVLNWPAIALPDNIRTDWIFNNENKQEQKKQIRTLLLLAICTNIILVILNSYPFLLQSSKIIDQPYEGGIVVTIMTICIYFINGYLIYENIRTFRNIDELFEQNIAKFSSSNSSCTHNACENIEQPLKPIDNNTPNVSDNIEQPTKQIDNNDKTIIDSNTPNIDNSTIIYDCKKQIDLYIDKCNRGQTPLTILKANIRILNAITDSYKKGFYKLTYQIIEQQLEEKISLAKRDFVKRESLLAIDILNMLKTSSADVVIKYLQLKYPNQ